MVFSCVPRDLVEARRSVSTILKAPLREFELAQLPRALFQRNENLAGELLVIKSKLFGPSDKTAKGISKEGWRYVELQASEEFMQSLKDFPESHHFPLGADSIQIWGGIRKEEEKDSTANFQGKSGWRNPGKNGGNARRNAPTSGAGGRSGGGVGGNSNNNNSNNIYIDNYANLGTNRSYGAVAGTRKEWPLPGPGRTNANVNMGNGITETIQRIREEVRNAGGQVKAGGAKGGGKATADGN